MGTRTGRLARSRPRSARIRPSMAISGDAKSRNRGFGDSEVA
nr:MAG TPA: hypothetical protein [Caudoviricetes sp.]